MISARDITEQKNGEEKIKKSEELYRTLAESITDKIYLIDKSRCITFVNSAAAKGFKLKKDANVCIDIKNIFPQESLKFLQNGIEKVFEKGEPLYSEIHETSGEDYWVEIRLSPVKNSSGEVTSMIGISHDITKRKKAEEEVAKSEKKYRGLVDNSLIGIYKTTADGKFLFTNDALAKLLGFENYDEMKNKEVVSIYKNPADRARFLEELKKNGKVSSFETEFITKNGEVKNVVISATIDGDILSGMVMDIEDSKKMEEMLKGKVVELEKFTKLSVGRELKMIELKKRIEELEKGVKK